MKKKASVSHDEWMIEELRADPKLAAEYLRQAMTNMSDPEGRGAAKLPLRRLAEAHGGMAAVAVEHGLRELVISRGRSGCLALYRFDLSRNLVRILAIRHQRESAAL